MAGDDELQSLTSKSDSAVNMTEIAHECEKSAWVWSLKSSIHQTATKLAPIAAIPRLKSGAYMCATQSEI